MADVVPFRLKLLGSFEAQRVDGSAIGISAKKSRALLAYLALTGGRTHQRGKLADLFWSDRGDKQARDSLRQALAELRDALADVHPAALSTDHDLVSFTPAAVDVDALRFAELAGRDNAAELRRAATLYEGDLLDSLDVRDPAFDDWLRDERQRYRELMVVVLKKLLAHETGGSAIAIAQRVLMFDPLQEDGYLALMRLHAEAGDIAAVLRQYDTCCATLKRELNITPSPETEALHKEIRGQSAPRVGRNPGSADVSHPPTTRKSKLSIAILPFRNLSDDAEQQYFSDGITEDIITELTRFRELFVIARQSSFQFRDKNMDIKHIGRDLGVEYVTEGSVRRVGNRIRVTAQTVEAATGNHIWAEHYDRELADLFAVQNEVAQTIAATLVGRVFASGTDKARRKPTKDWVAYDHFLQGRERLQQYDPDGAERHLQRALEIDPDFAQAHASRAFTYIVKFFFTGQTELLDQALAHAQAALSLDVGDAWAHAVLGTTYMFKGHLEAAGPHLEKSIALNPSDVEIATIHATWLSRMGRTHEALQNIDGAVKRDPYMSDWYWEARSIPLLQERRFEEVIETVHRMRQRQAWNHYSLAIAYAHLGMVQEAKIEAAEVLRLKPDYSEAWVIVQEPYKNPEDLQNLIEGLRKAGLPK